jgi:hypothetical protein
MSYAGSAAANRSRATEEATDVQSLRSAAETAPRGPHTSRWWPCCERG